MIMKIRARARAHAPLAASIAALSAVLSLPAPFALAQEPEVDEVVVQSTRAGRRVQDEPIRVEILEREEIEEKLLMTPGNISLLVSEMGGVRVQITSPALGAANIRMQGMSGRYTQLLADGLPIYGGQSSSLGLLQIPPTDLGQVEVIKGAASALYGPSALGGVINLISRRPGAEKEAEFLLNTTSRDGQDFTGYAASPLGGGWSSSLVAGFNRQTRHDLDGDGWIDTPGYERWTARPRLFWDGDNGAKAFFTIGAMTENRGGGTLPGRTAPDGFPFPQTQNSARWDAGFAGELPVAEIGTAHLRASAVTQKHDHLFGASIEDDRHDTFFAELSFASVLDKTSLLAGMALQSDVYRNEVFRAFDYAYTVPGIFLQAEHDVSGALTLAASARWDAHSEYGSYVSPRLSLLYRQDGFSLRASLGRGFYAPTPFVDEIEAAGLSRLTPPAGLKAETAETASLDAGYAFGDFETSVTLFASNLNDAVRVEPFGPGVRLVNDAGETRTRGTEFLLRYKREQFTVTGSYVYLDASEPAAAGAGRVFVPYTPRHTAGLVAVWEEHGKGRLGIEAYYTGAQRLEDNPYRTESESYVELGVLAEVVFGKARLFLNLENILDTRLTKSHPLVRPQRAADGRWTVDAWMPNEGFVVNGGLRVAFGGD